MRRERIEVQTRECESSDQVAQWREMVDKKKWRKGLGCLMMFEYALMHPAYAQLESSGEEGSPAAAEVSPDAGAAVVPPDMATVSADSDAGAVGAPAEQEEVSTASEETSSGGGVRNRMIEEVVVTAAKRAQNLQEVPSSVTAFSGTQLEAQGISDLKDMQLVTPGLTFDSMASYSIIFIRGIGGDAFQAAVDSSVATYIDGLYLPFTFSSAQALGDVQQVEVLKGPQGTLYGRNAVAGAILVKLKEPGNTYHVDVLQQVGNYNDSKTKAALSGPVPGLENLKFSVSGLYEDRDSFTVYYPDPSQKYIPYRNVGFRGALKWDVMDDLDVNLSYYYLKSQDADSVATVLLESSPVFAAITTPHNKPHETGNNTNVGVRGKTDIFSAVINSKQIDWFDTKLVYGHTEARSNIYFDFDSAEEAILDISALPNTARADSLELILNSNPATAPEWLQWTAGAYAEDSYKTGRYPITLDAVAIGVGVLDSLFQNTNPICGLLTAAGFDCTDNPATNQNPLVRVPLFSGIQTNHYSIYGQLTFNLTDALAAVAGGRIATEKRELKYSKVSAQVLNGPLIGDTGEQVIISYRPEEHSWDSFTPNLGLNYKVTDDILVYYKYSEAFKSGNYNGLNINKPPTRVEPELAASNEIGFKTELLDDRSIKFNGALFSTHVENAQVQLLALTSGGVTSLQNAAAYTVAGGEVEINWFATDALVFSLTGVYLDGKYDRFIGEGFSPTTGLNEQNVDFSGNKTVRTPEFTGTAAVNYTFPFIAGTEAEFGADMYYNDGFYYDPRNSVTQPSYAIYNARFGVFFPKQNLRLTLFGKNLTDEGFFTQKYRFDFGETGIWGAARTYGLTLTWAFDQ
eukprot:TRINITY_DN6670_c0_g1_i12.p1 TRINITY_DN6670_c0_g1~~TRINITY_DN6670_c0_g1_i12.p1  ORF type:complete len:857 (-),score=179.61 TRINITY_DN6670_c0_g1_i12:293-2863(-)